MRTKSINPKKLSLTESEWSAVIDITQETKLNELKSGVNFNGSNDISSRTGQNNSEDEQRLTSLIPPLSHCCKCSCFIEKKEQSTQTSSSILQECTPTLVANNISSDLPSPSWSSDSEGSTSQSPIKSKPYVCSTCAKTFPTPSKLRRHLLIHSGEKPYSCRVCSKPFNDPANLKRHYWSHVKEKPFVCSDCDGTYMTKRDAMMHLCSANKKRRR